ncbi:hypothetical protein ACFSTA_15960 [Ornithinibacillus salinisoli]|uniref:Lipoprotein n=1 Tax=Ornithinibacillus salinisoli TaxID=1848459 RepID=A0ABW4W4E6_9BACI
MIFPTVNQIVKASLLLSLFVIILIGCVNEKAEKNEFLSTEEGKYNLVMGLDGLESNESDKATEIMRATNFDNTDQVFIYHSISHSKLETQNLDKEELPIYLVFDMDERMLKTNSSEEVLELLK